MNIEDWELNESNSQRDYRVGEFIGADGSLPPDLAGKPLDEIAYIEVTPRPKTLQFQSNDDIPMGKPFPFMGATFAAVRREGKHFWAIEVQP